MIGQIPNVVAIAPFDPLPWQITPWRDRSFVLLLTGSAGGGKSRLAAEKLHAYCKRYAGAQALALRKTRESMSNSTLLFLERVVVGDDPSVHHLPSKLRFEYANGSILAYGGMADEAQREQIRSVGQQGGVDICWMEEANAFEEDDYNEVLARIRGKAASWRQVILTTNPDGPDHWINLRLIQEHEAAVYSSSAADNTHNPEEYRASLQKLSGILKQRLALGLWVAAEGMYFDEWEPAVHQCAPFEIPVDWPRWLSVDYGYADPFCCLWYARDPESRRVYIYRESYAKGLRDEQQADVIREKSTGERIRLAVGDPSMFAERRELGLPSIAAIYQAHGVPLAPAVNNRKQGWATVRRLLAYDPAHGTVPRLQILKGHAPNLVRTLPAMVHDPLDAEDLADKVGTRKTEDHAVDCLRYGLVQESIPVARMRTFDFKVVL
jgi:PBSX family phage terminase large subunit